MGFNRNTHKINNKTNKTKGIKNSKRKPRIRIEDLSTSGLEDSHVVALSKTLAKQIDREIFKKKYAPASAILKFVGVGAFLVASVAIPNLPLALKPFLVNNDEYEVWKRFNIPYLKRTLKRLEKQKLVEIEEKDGQQIVRVTETGKRRIFRYSLEELEITEPKFWDGSWCLVSYDIPGESKSLRDFFHEYLLSRGFYPLHESVFLHAYPCEKEVEFLKEYLGIGEHVRIFKVSKIENDRPFRKFFGV